MIRRLLLASHARNTLPGFLASWVDARIARDEAWSRAYHDLRVLERALPSSSSSSSSALSAAQLDKITAGVLDRVTVAASSSSSSAAAGAASSTRSAWLGLAGAVACAAVIFIVVRGPKGDDVLHPRGSSDAHAGLHVRCVDASRANLVAEADVKGGVVLTCPRGGLLAFSATNTSDKTLYVRGLAISEFADSASLFSLPFEGEPAFAVPPGSVDLPLPRGYALDDKAPARFTLGATLIATPTLESRPAPPAESTLHVIVASAQGPP